MRRMTGGIIMLFVVCMLVWYAERQGFLAVGGTGAAAEVGQVVWETGSPKVKQATEISFTLQDEKGENLRGLNEAARQAVRVLIIPPSLEDYEEVQPSFSGSGTFSFTHTFPQAGEYAVFAYTKNKEAGAAFGHTLVTVGTPNPKAKQTKLAPDALMSLKIGAYNAALIFPALRPGKPVQLTFQFSPKERKELSFRSAGGAPSYVLLTDEQRKHVLYAEAEGSGTGKELSFQVTFPEEGLYKLWAVLYVDGNKYEKSFVLHVAKPKS